MATITQLAPSTLNLDVPIKNKGSVDIEEYSLIYEQYAGALTAKHLCWDGR